MEIQKTNKKAFDLYLNYEDKAKIDQFIFMLKNVSLEIVPLEGPWFLVNPSNSYISHETVTKVLELIDEETSMRPFTTLRYEGDREAFRDALAQTLLNLPDRVNLINIEGQGQIIPLHATLKSLDQIQLAKCVFIVEDLSLLNSDDYKFITLDKRRKIEPESKSYFAQELFTEKGWNALQQARIPAEDQQTLSRIQFLLRLNSHDNPQGKIDAKDVHEILSQF